MTPSGSNGATIGQLAAEWRERLRRGEQPEMDDYLNRYPQLADEIRELFPAVVVMEDLKGDAGNLTGSVAVDALAVEGRKLERLGDYRILREIGRGGMGVVYEAEQESLGRRVALKVLPPQALLDPRYHKRFQREAKAAAKLHHTNIVPVFGVGEHEGTCYYVMQFIAGLGLDKVLEELKHQRQAGGAASAPRVSALPPTGSYHAEADLSAMDVARSLMLGSQGGAATVRERVPQEPLPDGRGSDLLSESGSHYWRSVARMGMQVAEALDYAGSQGILHRDIKPSNLLLDTRGNVWVTDFGLAKAGAEENLTHTGDVIGTLRYMAPERFEGRSNLIGDIYSLGLTLYELLTLQPAFGEKDRSKLIHQVTSEEPPPPRKIDPRIPRDLETIVLKAIARDPAHRYQTGTALAEDLQRFVEDRPILARRVSVRERFWRWCRRNPVVASLTAALFLVLIVGLIGVTTQWRRAESNAEQARRNEDEAKNQRDAAAATADNLRKILYASDMKLVQAAWEANDVNRVFQLLDRHRPRPGEQDLRGFEWHYWQRQFHSELSKVEIPDLKRSAINPRWAAFGSFDRNGKRLAAGVRSENGQSDEIRIWDAASGAVQLVIPGLQFYAFHPLALSPDGDYLAFQVGRSDVAADSAVKVWDIRSRKEILFIQKGEHLAFRPDSKRLAVSIRGEDRDKFEEGYRLKVWDLENRKELFAQPMPAPVRNLAFSPDGVKLAITTVLRDQTSRIKEASLRICNAANGKEQKKISLPPESFDMAVAFSPDGTRIVATIFTPSTVRSSLYGWDVASGKELFAVPMPGLTYYLRFRPDGKLLAAWGSFRSTIAFVDSSNGTTRYTLKGHTRDILDIFFSPDGGRITTASADGAVKTWAAPLSEKKSASKNPVWPLAISSDGSRIAVSPNLGYAKEIKVVDRGGKEIISLALPLGYSPGAAFSPDGRRLAVPWFFNERKNVAVKIWDATTGAKLLDLPMGEEIELLEAVFSPDGRRIAVSFRVRDSATGFPISLGVKMWDSGDGKELFFRQWRSQGSHVDVTFRPDGARLAALSNDDAGTLRIWDIATGQEILIRNNTGAWRPHLRYSPNGEILLASYGGLGDSGSARAWNPDTGKELMTFTGHSGFIADLAFSPNGRRIASLARTANRGYEVKLWDAASGQELLAIRAENRLWTRVIFSFDGRQLMALGGPSLTDLVQVWDATPLPEQNAKPMADDR